MPTATAAALGSAAAAPAAAGTAAAAPTLGLMGTGAAAAPTLGYMGMGAAATPTLSSLGAGAAGTAAGASALPLGNLGLQTAGAAAPWWEKLALEDALTAMQLYGAMQGPQPGPAPIVGRGSSGSYNFQPMGPVYGTRRR